jgi:sugar/nucleoside kinase (ribokinase family)
LGSGPFAEIARGALEAEGIAVPRRRRKEIDQGTCVVLVERGGERSFVSHHGAERWLVPADLEPIRPGEDDWILVSGYALAHPQSAAVVTAWLKRLPLGPKLLFDPGPLVSRIPKAGLAVALERADWVSANRSEAQALTGLHEPARAARALASARKGALARVGAEGCWLAAPNGEVERIAGYAVETLDTTGAGDAHDGAFIAASLMGSTPRAAATFANAAAAIVAARHGPATAPGLAETRAFLDARGADVEGLVLLEGSTVGA